MNEGKMLIGKGHFNFAMSKARKSVSERDLILNEELAKKQKAGQGSAVTNFKFQDSDTAGEAKDDSLLDEDL